MGSSSPRTGAAHLPGAPGERGENFTGGAWHADHSEFGAHHRDPGGRRTFGGRGAR